MKQQLIVGMPSSGKSTFIGALRHLLVANEVETELELTELADDERHVNRLENDWLECREFQRTKPATEGWVEFRVRNRKTGAEASLSIPDLRGETFEQPLCSGRCQQPVYEALSAADGLLLFTNADRADDSGLISDLNDLIGDEPAEPSIPAAKFNPDDMPEEIKIVELLQMVNRRPLRGRRRRIAIIVSAWDVVPKGSEPLQWFSQRRPVLDQFLTHNSELWEARLYGVSAQGGKLPADRRRLARFGKPSERIILVSAEGKSHDLTAPLSWLGAA